MLKGITISLVKRQQTGVDLFGSPVYEESIINVDNVIVYPSSDTEVLETVNLYGAKAVFTLCIPKGDANDWENTFVEFFGNRWKTIGLPKEYIESNVPLNWNKQVRVERVV